MNDGWLDVPPAWTRRPNCMLYWLRIRLFVVMAVPGTACHAACARLGRLDHQDITALHGWMSSL